MKMIKLKFCGLFENVLFAGVFKVQYYSLSTRKNSLFFQISNISHNFLKEKVNKLNFYQADYTKYSKSSLESWKKRISSEKTYSKKYQISNQGTNFQLSLSLFPSSHLSKSLALSLVSRLSWQPLAQQQHLPDLQQ